jgi:hypothetical protein
MISQSEDYHKEIKTGHESSNLKSVSTVFVEMAPMPSNTTYRGIESFGEVNRISIF